MAKTNTYLVLNAVHSQPGLHLEGARRQRWNSIGAQELIKVDDILLKVLLVHGHGRLEGTGLLGRASLGLGRLGVGALGSQDLLLWLGVHLGFDFGGSHVESVDKIPFLPKERKKRDKYS